MAAEIIYVILQILTETQSDSSLTNNTGAFCAEKTNVSRCFQLSRREREELEKQRAKAHYQKLHAAGKTEEAQADLARLAIIRKQREEAAKKREDEKLGKID